jgi:hypothetical protein
MFHTAVGLPRPAGAGTADRPAGYRPGARLVDPRGLRFSAGLTAVVLAVAMVSRSGWLLGVQAAVFAAGAVTGLRYAPYGLVFRRLVAPRLGPPPHREDAAAPRFAQAIGCAFAVAGVAGYAAGLGWLGLAATALAWVAAFLNAAFGFCIGCETYLLIRRLVPRGKASTRKGVTA